VKRNELITPQIIAASLALLFSNSLAAAKPNTLTPEETAAGWKLLFDGHSLTGWHIFQGKSPAPTSWHVEDGGLVNPKGNGRPNGSGGDLVTDGKYHDFEFRFEWRISPAGNSGIQYFIDEPRKRTARMYRGDTGHSPIGFEYQLLDDKKHPDAKRGPTHMAGALYDLIPAVNKTLKPVGEFNEGRIIVSGQHVEHWLNGSKVAECDLDTDTFREAFAKSKFHVISDFGKKTKTSIALQDHGFAVAFRNLKIRELHPK